MVPPPITDDYYMVLEVEQTATLELIVKSYRRLALKLHPDRNNKQNTTQAFQRVCQCFGAKLIFLSINVLLYVLTSDIKARTSLRDIEGRKQSSSLRPHLPLPYTKIPLPSNHKSTMSAFCFDFTARSTQRSCANRCASKVEGTTWCTMADQEECL